MVLKPRSKRSRTVIASSAILVLLAVAWMIAPVVERWASATVTVPMDRLRLATVSRGDLVRDVSVQGRVVASVSPTLYASAPGAITLLVEAGASVSAGQVLATIDSPELNNEFQQAQALLDQQAIELERQRIESRQLALDKRKAADLAEVALTAARREKRRADDANERNVISVIDFEKAQDELRNAELAHGHAVADADLFDERLTFELRASELSLQRQGLRVEELRRQVDNLSITSPVNGIVGDLLVAQKSAVSRDTPVMSVVDLTQFEIDAQIPESYADDLAIGMPAEIMIGASRYAGTLTAVSPEVIQNQVSSRIRFSGEMPPNLRQNQRLTTRVLLEERPDVLMLPRGQFLETGGGRIAYVLDGDGLALRRSIQVGARSLAAVEIERGLAEGDTVIISGIEQFSGAESVLITN
ncbi:MAG TPA: efflux RND transporter periplasmic adaptor subunit [Woeseiaceae bacterium]|nr:efflux RND transporter periplasmic adaptor subunit [Woeseiaceae bacterium]